MPLSARPTAGQGEVMSATLIIGLFVILPICHVPAPTQGATPPDFRLVSAKNVETLQQELDRAAAEGYAVALAWPAYDLVLLRRRAESELVCAYRVLDGQKAITASLAAGYRALPDTLDVRGGALRAIAVPPRPGEAVESLLLTTNRTGTLDQQIRDARGKGFHVIALASDDSGHAALLERSPGERLEPADAEAGALIAASSQDTLQKELADRAAAGYHVAQASSWKETLLVLERGDAGEPFEYRVVSTTKSSTLEREMNAAAASGFRFTPGTLHAQQKGAVPLFGRTGTDYVVIMEKRAGASPVPEYVVVGARRMGTLIREFDEAVAKGLVPVAMTLGYSDQETLVLFEGQRR